MRQLKDQARRMQARDLLTDELKRMEVQSDTLNKQVEELGRPTTQLNDQERALFKDPQISVSDSDEQPGLGGGASFRGSSPRPPTIRPRPVRR